MRGKAFLLLGLVSFSCFAQEGKDGQLDLETLLLSAKFSGMCGTIRQLAGYQQYANSEGGTIEFVASFYASEASRLGITTDQLLEKCQETTDIYNKFMDALPEAKKELTQ